MYADAAGHPLKIELGVCAVDRAAGNHIYRHLDFRGNVKAWSDDSGQIEAVATYTGYALAGVEGDQSNQRWFAQGIVGGALVFLGGRVYDQDAMQFLSPDPVFNLLNQFAYAQGDPVNFWDPDGMTVLSAGFKFSLEFSEFIGAVALAVWAGPEVAVGAAIVEGVGIGIGGILVADAGADAASEAFSSSSSGPASGQGSGSGSSGGGGGSGGGAGGGFGGGIGGGGGGFGGCGLLGIEPLIALALAYLLKRSRDWQRPISHERAPRTTSP